MAPKKNTPLRKKIGHQDVPDTSKEISFSTLLELYKNKSTISKDNERKNEQVCMTTKERKSLEEITRLASLYRVPIDDRQMLYFKRDADKFVSKMNFQESSNAKEIKKALGLVKEHDASNVTVTDAVDLENYLNNLKKIIAQREINWAAATENDYSQRIELMRLKNETNHLRIMLSKRQSDISEKNKELTEKEQEIARLNRHIQRLKNDANKFQNHKSEDDSDN